MWLMRNRACFPHARCLLLFLVCLAVEWSISSARAGALEWKREGGTVRLGSQKEYPVWASVDAPSNVVQFATEMLGGNTDKWDVNNYTDKGGYHIVDLACGEWQNLISWRQHLVFLVLPDRWVLLNHGGALGYINRIVATVLTLPADLKDPELVAYYVQEVAYLFKGPDRVALSNIFLRQADEKFQVEGVGEVRGIRQWMGGTEKDPEALRKLCGDPQVETRGDHIRIECNLITRPGSAEHWILTGILGNTIELTDISVEQIREDGTFSWGLIP